MRRISRHRHGEILVEGERLRVQYRDHRQKLQDQMPLGVVKHRAIDERATIETFLRMPMEADMQAGAGEIRKNAADTREQFSINNGIESERTRAHNHPHTVGDKAPQRTVIQRQHVLGRSDAKQVEYFTILGESST